MHLSSTLAVTLLVFASLQSVSQASKEELAQCKSEMEAKHKAESDKDLADKLSKIDQSIKGTIGIVQGLNDAQKAKLVNTYFAGICAPIKDFYNL